MLSAIFVDRPRLGDRHRRRDATIAGALSRFAGDPVRPMSPISFPRRCPSPRSILAPTTRRSWTRLSPNRSRLNSSASSKMIYMKSVSGDDGSYTLDGGIVRTTAPIRTSTPSTSTTGCRPPSPACRRRFNARASRSKASALPALLGAIASTRRSTATILCFCPTTSPSTRPRPRIKSMPGMGDADPLGPVKDYAMRALDPDRSA